jgi:hypothetical protein
LFLRGGLADGFLVLKNQKFTDGPIEAAMTVPGTLVAEPCGADQSLVNKEY